MKRILFVITSFRHGGINKSLQNLSFIIDIGKYSIDVFALEHYGPYNKMLPKCNLLEKDKWIESLIGNWGDTKGLARIRSTLIKSINVIFKISGFNFTNLIFKHAARRYSRENYDAVIAFSEGVPTVFVSYIFNKNKIAWVHCDYTSYMKLNNYPNEISIYNSYDSVVCVSKYTKMEFCKHFPLMTSKVNSIYNILDSSLVINDAKRNVDDIFFTKNQFNIISIGGINVVKRFSRIPKIVRTLIDRGCYFRWYLIGSTMQIQEQKELDDNISKYDVKNFFFCLGAKDNPYPYIAQCDLLVNTSSSEAAPYVVNEAKILHTPVICADFGSAAELIEDGVNGYILPLESMADKIELLIKNEHEYGKIKIGISGFIYNNEQILKKVYKLFEN